MTYLRGQAVAAAARIGPGDPEVVAALIKVIHNPNPKSSSGVQGSSFMSGVPPRMLFVVAQASRLCGLHRRDACATTGAVYLILSSSTSKTRSALGGMSLPAPRSP